MDRKKYFLIGLAIIIFFSFQSLAFAQKPLAVKELQETLRMKGAKWTAGETSMTRLSPAERQKRLGLIPPLKTGPERNLSMEALEQAPLLDLPASIDWRNNGGNFVPTILGRSHCKFNNLHVPKALFRSVVLNLC